jgi:hypothetical protein
LSNVQLSLALLVSLSKFPRSNAGIISYIMPIALLRNLQTGAFFCKDDLWVPEAKLAHNFEKIETAAQYAIDRHLKNVDFVVMDPEYTVVFGTRIDLD